MNKDSHPIFRRRFQAQTHYGFMPSTLRVGCYMAVIFPAILRTYKLLKKIINQVYMATRKGTRANPKSLWV